MYMAGGNDCPRKHRQKLPGEPTQDGWRANAQIGVKDAKDGWRANAQIGVKDAEDGWRANAQIGVKDAQDGWRANAHDDTIRSQ